MNKEIILFLNSLNTYLLKYVSINLLKSLKKKKKGYPKLNDQNRSPQFSSSIDKIKILLIRKVKGSTKFYTLSLSLSLQPLLEEQFNLFQDKTAGKRNRDRCRDTDLPFLALPLDKKGVRSGRKNRGCAGDLRIKNSKFMLLLC